MSLSAKELRVWLSGKLLLDNLNFTADAGEFLAIVGPNGAGKTTLLKAIAGLIDYEGLIEWQERDLRMLDPSSRARTFSYLPQGHVVHWPITAREAITIGRAPYSSSLTHLSADDEEAIERALNAVDGLAFAGRPVTELSGGERARIMLARALAVDAPVMLVDEPVAALDPAHQLSVMNVLAEQAKQGRLIVCVSHDLALASRFADRFIVIGNGKIAALGSYENALTDEIFEKIFNVRTKRFKSGEEMMTLPWNAI